MLSAADADFRLMLKDVFSALESDEKALRYPDRAGQHRCAAGAYREGARERLVAGLDFAE
jgi:hypothetical protein